VLVDLPLPDLEQVSLGDHQVDFLVLGVVDLLEGLLDLEHPRVFKDLRVVDLLDSRGRQGSKVDHLAKEEVSLLDSDKCLVIMWLITQLLGS
jgi:hypothetical protein